MNELRVNVVDFDAMELNLDDNDLKEAWITSQSLVEKDMTPLLEYFIQDSLLFQG